MLRPRADWPALAQPLAITILVVVGLELGLADAPWLIAASVRPAMEPLTRLRADAWLGFLGAVWPVILAIAAARFVGRVWEHPIAAVLWRLGELSALLAFVSLVYYPMGIHMSAVSNRRGRVPMPG